MDHILVADWAGLIRHGDDFVGDICLDGGVGQKIDGAMGEDVFLGALQRGVTRGERIQPSQGRGESNIDGIPAVTVVASKAGLQYAIVLHPSCRRPRSDSV